MKRNNVASDITLASPLVAAKNQIAGELGADIVLLDLNAGFYHGLNATSARIWKLLQKPRTGLEICGVIQSEYEVERFRCERDVLAVLKDFAAKGLIEPAEVVAGAAQG